MARTKLPKGKRGAKQNRDLSSILMRDIESDENKMAVTDCTGANTDEYLGADETDNNDISDETMYQISSQENQRGQEAHNDVHVIDDDTENINSITEKEPITIETTCPCCHKDIREVNMIQCDTCTHWIHYECTGIPGYHLLTLEKSGSDSDNMKSSYTCSTCTEIPEKFEVFDNCNTYVKQDKYEDILSNIEKNIQHQFRKIESGLINTITTAKEEIKELKYKILQEQLEKKNIYIKLLEEKEKNRGNSTTECECETCDKQKQEITEHTKTTREQKRRILELELEIEVVKSRAARNEKELKNTISTQESLVSTLADAEEKTLNSLKDNNDFLSALQQKNKQLHETIIQDRENIAALKHFVADNDNSKWSTVVKTNIPKYNSTTSINHTPPIYSTPLSQPEKQTFPEQQLFRSPGIQNKANATNLLVGSSHLHNVYAGKMDVGGIPMHKKIAYTADQAEQFINEDGNTNRKAVAFHILGNDLKTLTVQENCGKIQRLVQTAKTKYIGAKIIISLATPRMDSTHLTYKAEQLNDAVVQALKNTDISFVENSNLGARGVPRRDMYTDDGVHHTPFGTARLARNIKAAVARSLNITHQNTERR